MWSTSIFINEHSIHVQKDEKCISQVTHVGNDVLGLMRTTAGIYFLLTQYKHFLQIGKCAAGCVRVSA